MAVTSLHKIAWKPSLKALYIYLHTYIFLEKSKATSGSCFLYIALTSSCLADNNV